MEKIAKAKISLFILFTPFRQKAFYTTQNTFNHPRRLYQQSFSLDYKESGNKELEDRKYWPHVGDASERPVYRLPIEVCHALPKTFLKGSISLMTFFPHTRDWE